MTTPTSASDQPPTWKTNVNRSKTKRWVEAKSYSYDGDDWGEVDDYDEYPGYDEEPAPAHKPTDVRPHVHSPTGPAQSHYDQPVHQAPTSPEGPSHGGRQAIHPSAGHSGSRGPAPFERGDAQQAFPTGVPPSHIQADGRRGPQAPSDQSYQQAPFMVNHDPSQSLGRQHRTPLTHSEGHRDTEDKGSDYSSAPPGEYQHPPRKSSVGQQSQQKPVVDQTPSTVAPTKTARERQGSSASIRGPFIRPADIYKRMEEERERERLSQDSARPSLDAITGRPQDGVSREAKNEKEGVQHLRSGLDPVSERKSEYGFEGFGANPQDSQLEPQNVEKARTTSKSFNLSTSAGPPAVQNSRLSGKMILPDPTRMSGFGEGFGESFMTPADKSSHDRELQSAQHVPTARIPGAGSQSVDHNATELRHQPSKGYTSAVHQAFDNAQDQVPPTPSSVADSYIARSSSGGTNAVSPIMSRGPSAVDRDHTRDLPSIEDVTTPTQDVENEKSRTRPRAAGSIGTINTVNANSVEEPPPPGFKMGHRRNSGTPSPDNSPAKTPVLASMSRLRYPQEAELAHTTPTPTDSVPSASSSFRDFGRPASPVKTVGERSDSPGGGRVKNLTEKFEGSSRPDSAQSNTTPRQSVIAPTSPDSAASPDVARPANTRLESFRPQLPGGWQSQASIAPQGAQVGRETNNEFNHAGAVAQPTSRSRSASPDKSSLSTIDPSKTAFAAAAVAGSALAAAIATAAGVNRPEGPKSPLKNEDSKESVVSKQAGQPLNQQAAPDRIASSKTIPLVAPSTKVEAEPGHIGTSAKQPSSLPPLNTRESSGEYESDRLRREIVRELDPGLRSDPTTADTESSYPNSSRYPTNESLRSDIPRSTGLPSEYDKYWDEEDGIRSASSGAGQKTLDSPQQATQPLHSPISTTLPPHQEQSPPPASRMDEPLGTLARKFSWEQPLAEMSAAKSQQRNLKSTSEGADEFQPNTAEVAKPPPAENMQPELIKGPIPVQHQESAEQDHLNFMPELGATPQLTLNTFHDIARGPDLPSDNSKEPAELDSTEPFDVQGPSSVTKPTGEHLPQNQSPKEPGSASKIASSDAASAQVPQPPSAASTMPKMPAFREILSMKSSQERIHAFTTTQQQFANYNTGLDQWLAATINDLPEHGDLVKSSGRIGGGAPGLASRPTGSLQHGAHGSPAYASVSSSSASTPGGKISTQQVQAKGKEFLHTAGVFSGKANVAAKGLFSKGKSKLRDASGSKKAPESQIIPDTRGMQPQTSHTQAEATIPSDTSQRSREVLPQHNQDSPAGDKRRSWARISDRLPRSSKIFQGAESSEKRKSRVLEPSPEPSSTSDERQLSRSGASVRDPVGEDDLSLPKLRDPQRHFGKEDEGKHGITDHGFISPPGHDGNGPTNPVTVASTHNVVVDPVAPFHPSPAFDSGSRNLKQEPANDIPIETSVDDDKRLTFLSVSTTGAGDHEAQARASADGYTTDSKVPVQRDGTIDTKATNLTGGAMQAPPSPESPVFPPELTGQRQVEPDAHESRSSKRRSAVESNADRQGRRSQSYARSHRRRESRSASKTSRRQVEDEGRVSMEDVALPPNFYPGNLGRDETLIPRHQATEYSLEGVGPPDIPQTESRARSRRGSKSSAFFKRLSRTFTDSDHASQGHGAERGESSPAASSIALGKRRERSSTLGYQEGQIAPRTESTHRPVLDSRASSNTNALPGDNTSRPATKDTDDEFPMRPKQRNNSSSVSKRFQKTSVAPVKDADTGKKNRFSRLGTIFGRSDRKQAQALEASQRKSAHEKQISDPVRLEGGDNLDSHRESFHGGSMKPLPVSTVNPQRSVQEKNDSFRSSGHYEYYHPRAPPPPPEPPLGGFYAPSEKQAGSQPLIVTPQEVSGQTQPIIGVQGSNAPAYFQDLSTRSPATSPPAVEPRPIRQNRGSVDFFQQASHTYEADNPPVKQRRESRSAWTRFSRQRRTSKATDAVVPVQQPHPTISKPEVVDPRGVASLPPPPSAHDIQRYDSPPPPPPPPKDEWHVAAPRRSSLATKPLAAQDTNRLPNLNTSLNQRSFHGAPSLQTDVPSPSLGDFQSGFTSPLTSTSTKIPQGMSYDEQRRSRQWELEHVPTSPVRASMSTKDSRRSRIGTTSKTQPMTLEEKRQSKKMELETGHLSPEVREEIQKAQEPRDEEIKMSATSLPGQEWMPEHAYGWAEH